jgi:chromosome partitioning protein
MPPEPLAFDPTARTISRVLVPRQIPYRVVINAWDPRDGESDLEQTREYIAAQNWPCANVVVRRYKVHTRAAADGRVVTQYPKNRTSMEAREDFFRLALELGYGGR